MKLKNRIVAVAMMLTFAAMFSTAFAAPQSEFSALQGVDAQALSVEEMQAISGELNAIDIGNALLTLAGRVSSPRVAAFITKLANYYLTNADQINAFFAKLGILTPCRTCAP